MSAEVSHGRGGAGNITPDNTKYVDGEIVREGEMGPHGDGAYSTGRGGAANIGDASHAPAPVRADHDVVPAAATRPSLEGDYHVGRGGAANVQRTPEHQAEHDAKHHHHHHHGKDKVTDAPPAPAEKATHRGLADKLKHKLMGVFKK
ncbi:hypothetical protein F4780DRAFT_308623 [Xylariomycetidae sp. FL0641]|nr:hypothetical protein F4780DRAFT_308623 [Xylariomycetidae sp. FL0641]